MPELSLQDLLLLSAQNLPDKIALTCGGRQLTYRELDIQTNTIAHYLVERGVAPQDRILICAENGVETVLAFWGALKANTVVSIISPETKPGKFAHYVNDLNPKILITQGQFLESISFTSLPALHLAEVIVVGNLPSQEAMARAEEDGITFSTFDTTLAGPLREAPPRRTTDAGDLAVIIYTSGSSGSPKGVMLTHSNMLAASGSINSYLCNTETDVLLCALPLSFDYGLYQMILAFQVGARLVLERSFKLLPQILSKLDKEGVTAFPCVPTVAALLDECPPAWKGDYTQLRYVTSTGAALTGNHVQTLKETFPKAQIFSMYGLTECKRCTYLPPADLDRKPGSVGIAIPGTRIWIADELGRAVEPGIVGELVIDGGHVMSGYWNNAVATRRKLKPDPVSGATVLYSGDLCYMDADGYLYFSSRMDDIFKCRGLKVAPREIENEILKIDGVKDVFVIGIEDSVLGHAIVALVTAKTGFHLSAKQLRHQSMGLLESSLIPQHFKILDKFPTHPQGKIDKKALLEKALRGESPGQLDLSE
jgi:amino acid adenylation domain-containing protein